MALLNYKHFSRSMGETSFQRLNEAVQIMQAGGSPHLPKPRVAGSIPCLS